MKVTEAYAAKGRQGPLIACDFSPPRSAGHSFLREAAGLDADFICVAYGPGRSVRLGSVAAAALIQRETGKGTIFNLATRDMNKLAVQTHLLEAAALGLQNVLVLRGDPLTERDQRLFKAVDDYAPTELLRDIAALKSGKDFRGNALDAPVNLCAGAAIDLGKPVEEEARLAARKLEAGAEFLMGQAVFEAPVVEEFRRQLEHEAGRLRAPVFYGVAVLIKEGVVFGSVPDRFRSDLERGRSGEDIALEVIGSLSAAGCDAFYIVPPIFRGGARDYGAAQKTIAEVKRKAPV